MEKSANVGADKQLEPAAVPSIRVRHTTFGRLCNYFDVFDSEYGMRRLTLVVCVTICILPTIRLIVEGINYDEEIEEARGTGWSRVDSGSLWIIVSSLFLILTSVYVGIQAARNKASSDDRSVMYIQSVITLCVITYAESGSGFYCILLLPVVPVIGAIFEISGWLISFSVVLVAVVGTIVLTSRQYYSNFLRFQVPENSVMGAALLTMASLVCAVVPSMFYYWLKKEKERKTATTEFITELVELLVAMNIHSAEKKIEERERDHGRDGIILAARKLTANLATMRTYLPTALLSTEAFDDDDDEGVEDEGSEDDEGAPVPRSIVEKSNFKKRWSTILHVVVTKMPQDALEAEKISQRVSDAVIPKVLQNRGIVDNLNPNFIIATFNCHVPCVIHETEAANCALSIAADLSQYSDFKFCIVVSTGFNLIGSCGVDTQRAKVVIGESVELAMKIPSLAISRLGCKIILTEDTANKIGCEVAPVDAVCCRFPGRASRTVTLFELRSARKENAPQAWASAYSNAFSVFRMGDYENASAMWKNYCDRNERDAQARRLQFICEKLETTKKPKEDGSRDPYVRNETQWEGFEGNFMDKLLLDLSTTGGASGGSHSISQGSLSTKQKGQVSISQGGGESDLVNVVRSQFQQKEQAMEYQEDGLFSMFVAADDEDENGAEGNNNNGEEEVSLDVPRTFSDAAGTEWSRSDNQIGEGAFSTVFLALGEQGNLVAMKCFSLAKKQTDQEELITEVDTLSRLRNDYIVGYVSYALTQNYFIILMEYVSGGSLWSLLRQFGPLPTYAARRYLVDLVKGLRYLHENGITHCDIKPHNALLSNDGTCKLSDFGSSVGQQRVTAEGTQENIVRGTSWYIAPEAARGDIMPANDIWSLGITLIEMMTGSHPWNWRGGEANFIVKLGKDETMVPEIPSSIPAEASAVCKACCERDPQKRPTVNQLLVMPFLN